ncbi:MAG: tetratricopeptide repeat protein [Candidatus Poribacteria bacterium]
MNWDFITKIFQGIVNIERAYKSCDKALGLLKDYNKNPDAFTGEKKTDMDDIVKEAEDMAKKLLSFEGEKNWPGVFREMHKNLATMYIEMGRYDDAREHCNQMNEYGEVGRTESAEVLRQIDDRESGKKEQAA